MLYQLLSIYPSLIQQSNFCRHFRVADINTLHSFPLCSCGPWWSPKLESKSLPSKKFQFLSQGEGIMLLLPLHSRSLSERLPRRTPVLKLFGCVVLRQHGAWSLRMSRVNSQQTDFSPGMVAYNRFLLCWLLRKNVYLPVGWNPELMKEPRRGGDKIVYSRTQREEKNSEIVKLRNWTPRPWVLKALGVDGRGNFFFFLLSNKRQWQ